MNPMTETASTNSRISGRGREPQREGLRSSLRDEQRPEPHPPVHLEPGQFLGRDNEILTRRSHHHIDEFDVPENLKQPGWSYQWNTVTVHNQQNFSAQRDMYANGWRPVRPGDLQGYFDNYAEGKNEIVHKGLRLEMRPEAMTLEARADELRAANAQYFRHLKRADHDVAMPREFAIDDKVTNFRKEGRESVPDDLKPRYRPQVTPAGDE